jgi:hypothetical protein
MKEKEREKITQQEQRNQLKVAVISSFMLSANQYSGTNTMHGLLTIL